MPATEYAKTLITDLKSHHLDMQGRVFQSVFIGGGTPSLFPTDALERIFNYLFTNNLIARDAEITLEANPGTIEHGLFSDYYKMGINRISLGVQSFQNDKLKSLGRIHDSNQILQAVDSLKSAKFDNFNIDIMHGLPNQSVSDALFDLQSAIDLKPTHISWYQLTIEPNTAFFVRPPSLPDEDNLYNIEQQGKALLLQNGFDQYEVSAYSKTENTQSQHNLNYWRFGDYIGIGAGAHGKITHPDQSLITRHRKRKHPSLYLKEKTFPFHSEAIHPKELPYEFMLNTLRLYDGFDPRLFESATGLSIETIRTTLNNAQKKGLLDITDHKIAPTAFGKQYLNELIQLFI